MLQQSLQKCCNISASLCRNNVVLNVRNLNLLVNFLNFINFLLGVVVLAPFQREPIAFVANDAVATLRPRVQIAGSAIAHQARDLGRALAEAAMPRGARNGIRGASAPSGRLVNSRVHTALGG